jgi:hypothetical protein
LVRVLLTACFCWSVGPVFAQNPKANPNANQNAQNPVKGKRDDAQQRLDAAVAARIQVDPQFKAYVDAVNAHDQGVKDFVKTHQNNGNHGGGK